MIAASHPERNRLRLFTLAGWLLATLWLTGQLANTAVAETISGAKPLSPQPAADDIQPGLAVTYYYSMFEDVADISRLVRGKPGKPIMELDHDSDSGKVLTATRSMGVGAEIRGMIHFKDPGTYQFRVNSNDGVKLMIDGIVLHEDPYIHSDTMSPAIELLIEETGWYELAIDYYQKKGTSALGLYWTPPNGSETPVPRLAYGHVN